jgi:synapsin
MKSPSNPLTGSLQVQIREFSPDFILIRSEVRGVQTSEDFRNKLYALMYSDIPTINSLNSIYHFLERPIVHAELTKVTNRIGDETFPVIPQNYFPVFYNMMFTLPFPATVKMGHAPSGYGSMDIQNHRDFEDFRSVVALTDKYVTAEPIKDVEYSFCIQNIGGNLSAFKVVSDSEKFPSNTRTLCGEEFEVTPQYQMWADEVGKFFGGLDIFTINAIHTKKGKDYILEVKGNESELFPSQFGEPQLQIRDLVIQKMQEKLQTKKL